MSYDPPKRNDDHLAYGDYYEGQEESGETGDRGLIGDTFRRFQNRHQHSSQDPYADSQHSDVTQAYQPHLQSQNPSSRPPDRPNGGPAQDESLAGSLFDKIHHTVHGLGTEITKKLSSEIKHSHTHSGCQCDHGTHDTNHRYQSFAPQRDGNDVKWFVDGCGYMWAVSRALECASESIWILDWWLSPELYLRRPPAKNESYRLDRLLLAAAQRGVKVNIIVYKEVTQALTRKYLSPTLPDYLHSLLHRSTHPAVSAMSRLGLAATFLSLEKLEAENPLIAPPVTVSSSHTKHALEDLHPNISVFRHPDHLPDAQTLQSSFLSSLQNLSLTASMASKLPADALKAIYGMNEDVILYWAHHEKLCLVDGEMAFMGGLDLCYGRWDTNQHPIADAHPGNLDETVFPGQDYNNARIMDFQDVVHYEQNKLDRKTSSRMGWSDMSICLKGPIIQDLQSHFVERWNFIYNEKYDVRKDTRYSRLSMTQNSTNPTTYGQAPQQAPSSSGHPQTKLPSSQPNRYDQGASQTSNQQPYFPPPPGRREVESERGYQGDNSHQDQERHHGWERAEEGVRENLRGAIHEGVHHVHEKYEDRFERNQQHHAYRAEGAIPCQLVRSCTKWSNGTPTEHSIANAYIKIIEQSQHFVYIENQFFITATSDSQKPIRNKIGAAIVERIIRAARQGQKYKMIVVMPSVPAFAGDLKEDSALGTRAIMEFQYDSINRGGHSIMEEIARQGIDPMQYIRFYNLRNYDRINASSAMAEVEARSGVNYDDARRQHDDMLGAGFGGRGEGTGVQDRAQGDQYQRYQEAAGSVGAHQGLGKGRWDSVSECYMLGGEDIRNVPWENGDINEIDAFVSEELYVHSKVLIADDQVVICGSANLNDRSQLGDHDSEIALIIEDPTSLDSSMNGRPWRASRFAATLRRQMFRKHLGLLRSQDMERPDQNFEPVGVPNGYDFGSGEDRAVEDPLADSFHGLWNSRARVNTEAFGRVFHCVPHDNVKNWKDYEQFYERYFHEEGKEGNKRPAKYQWGHVVAEEFAPGDQGVREMKDVLSQIRGTLVEMPLLFLIEEDIAKEGISLNAFTEELYT